MKKRALAILGMIVALIYVFSLLVAGGFFLLGQTVSLPGSYTKVVKLINDTNMECKVVVLRGQGTSLTVTRGLSSRSSFVTSLSPHTVAQFRFESEGIAEFSVGCRQGIRSVFLTMSALPAEEEVTVSHVLRDGKTQKPSLRWLLTGEFMVGGFLLVTWILSLILFRRRISKAVILSFSLVTLFLLFASASDAVQVLKM